MINKDKISSYLDVPMSVQVYDELISTNLTAKELADACFADTVIFARRQSGGRGRMGRSFFSPEGGLYMSLLLHPKMRASSALNVTTAAAVAVSRAIEAVSGKKCTIKWVNDVYIEGRKVCGILTESKIADNGELSYAVLGIGINLTPPEGGFPDDIKNRAGAVFDDLSLDCDNRIAAAVINEFMSLYRGGLNTSDYLEEYRRRSHLIGRRVDVMRVHDGEARVAEVLSVDDECSLVVRYDDGTVEALSSGDVSVRE